MRDKAYLRGLLDYNAWANAELYAKVRELPPEEVTKKRKTLLESIHLSLNHLLAVDHMWLAHMQGRAHGITELRARLHEDLDELWAARRDMDRTLLEYLDTLDGEALEEIVEILVQPGAQLGDAVRAALHVGEPHVGPAFDIYLVYPEELRNSQRIIVFRDFLVRSIDGDHVLRH